jgi:hypothetical protein
MFAVLMIGAVAFASGCKEVDPSAISVSDRMFRVGIDAQELELRVISNTDWKAEITPADADYTAGGWVMLSRTSGRGSANLSIFIEPYIDKLAAGRQAVIKFTTGDGDAMATVVINQSLQKNILEIMPEELEIGSAAQSIDFMVLSNTEWTITGDCPWARVVSPTTANNNGDVMVTIEVDEFESHGENRSYGFFLTAGNASESVGRMFTLTQRGQPDPTLILGHENLYFDAIVQAGVTDNISVPFITSVDEGEGEVFAATNQPWLKAEIIKNNGVSSVKITVTSNDQSLNVRTGEVYVTASVDNAPVTKKIVVTQAGSAAPNFDLMRDVITIDDKALGADPNVQFSFKFIPYGNAVVKLLPDFDSWITATIDSSDPTTVNVVAEPNYTNETRTTSISLYAEGGGTTVKKSVTVIQRAAGEFNLKITPETANVGTDAQTITYYVVSDLTGVNFVPTSSKSWVDVSVAPEAAIANFDGTAMKFTANVEANNEVSGRTATITVLATYGMKSDHVVLNITQSGTGAPEAVIGRNALTVPQKGADYSIGVGNSEGTTITCTSTVPWIVAKGGSAGSSPVFNATDKTIDFTVQVNDQTHSERTGIIDVIVEKGGATQFLSIAITQLGMGSAELIISQTDITVDAPAISIEVPILAQNGTWEVLGMSSTDPTMFAGTPTKRSGDPLDVLTIRLTANTTAKERSGNVGILATNGDSSVTYIINVTQKGLEAPEITPIAMEVRVGAARSTMPIQVPLLDWDSTIDLSTPLYAAPSDMFSSNLTRVVTYRGTATLNIGVTANTSLSERTGVVTITAKRGGLSAVYRVTVIQAGADTPTLLFPDYSYSFGPDAQRDLNVIFDNINGANITVEAYPSWFTSEPRVYGNPDNTITFSIPQNEDDEARTGTILLKATLGNNFAYYNVALSQAGQASLGAMLSASNIVLDWDVDGRITSPVVTINNLPTATTLAPEVTAISSSGWLRVTSPVSVRDGIGTLSLTTTGVNPMVNDRSAVVQIFVQHGTQIQPLTLTVTQMGAPAPTAFLATDVLNVSATQGGGYRPPVFTIPFLNTNDNVTYGTPVTDDVAQEWASVSVRNNTVQVTIRSANTGVDTRTVVYTIPITAAGQTTTARLTINQYGTGEPVLNFGTTSFLIGSKGQTDVQAFFENPNDATVSVVSWPAGVTRDNSTDLDSGVLVFDVAPAPSTEARTGDIVLRADKGGKSVYYHVTVAQNGLAALNPIMSTASIITGPKANSITEALQVLDLPTSGVTVSYTSTQEWLDSGGTPTTLDSPYAFTPTIEANTGGMRQGTIIVKVVRTTDTSEVAYLTVSVTQQAVPALPDVLADPTGVVLESEARGSDNSIILYNWADGYSATIQRSGDWIYTDDVSYDDGVAWFSIRAESDNTAAAPRIGIVTLTVTKTDGTTQKVVIGVMQKGTLPVAIEYPIGGISAVSGLTFEADESGEGVAESIDVFGFNEDVHNFSYNAPSWLTVVPPSSPMEIYPNSANTGSAPRSGMVDITITAKDTTVLAQFSIPVTQLGTDSQRPEVTFTPASHNATFEGGAVTVKVSNPSARQGEVWTTSTDQPGWLTGIDYDLEDNDLTFMVQSNPTTSGRSGFIVLSDPTGQFSYSFPVTQAPIPSDPIVMQLAWLDQYHSPVLGTGDEAGFVLTMIGNNTRLVSITPEADGATTLPEDDWFTVEPSTDDALVSGLSEGQSAYVVRINKENDRYDSPRSANVTIVVSSPDGEQTLNYTVNQAPAPLRYMTDISMTPYENAFEADGTAVSPATGTVTLNNSGGIVFTSVTSAIKGNVNWLNADDNFAFAEPTEYMNALYVNSPYEGEIPRFAVVEVTLKAYGYHDYVTEFQVAQYPEQPAGGVVVQHQYDIPAAAGTYTDIIKIANLPDGFGAENFSLHALAADLHGSSVFFTNPDIVAAAVDGEQYIKITTTANPGMYPRANLLTFDVTDGTDTYTYNVILNQLGAGFIGDPDNPSMNPDLSYLLDLSNITNGMWNTFLYPNKLRPSDSGDTISIPLKQLPEGVTASASEDSNLITSATISNGQLVIDCEWVLVVGGNADVTVTLSNGQVITVPVNTSPTIGDSN